MAAINMREGRLPTRRGFNPRRERTQPQLVLLVCRHGPMIASTRLSPVNVRRSSSPSVRRSHESIV